MTWWHDQAGRYPLLTAAQEIHLGQAVRRWLDHPDPVPPAIVRRGQRARQQFVTANLRLVINCADRYRSVPEHYRDDLIQAGNIGLCKAVEKFDPSRGYKFSTYAYWWIRQGIHGFLERSSRTIRLPTNHALQWLRLQAAAERLGPQLGRPPTRAELAAETGLSLDLVAAVLTRPVASVALDAPNRHLDDAGPLGDSLAAPADDPLDAISDASQLEAVLRAMVVLDPRQQRIIEDQFLSPCPSTADALAAREGISRQACLGLKKTALRRLRMILNRPDEMSPPQPAPPSCEPLPDSGQQLVLAL